MTEPKLGEPAPGATPEDMARDCAPAERPTFDLSGWKVIAQQLGMSRRFAYDAAHREDDPLPVFKIGRAIFASSMAINEWVRRQARPLAPPAPSGAASGTSLRLVAASG